MASDSEGVCCKGGLHFGVVEVDDRSLICKHVNLQQMKETSVTHIIVLKKKFLTNFLKKQKQHTSSIPEMLLTPSFFKENWSFLSSAVAVL